MRVERARALGAGTDQRTDDREGHSDGYKPRTIHTGIGPLTVQVSQARGIESYPSCLERGIRGERAAKLAVAEMYVRRGSTRKVAAITEKLCGKEVTSGEVSRAARALGCRVGEVTRSSSRRDALPDPGCPLRGRAARRPGRLVRRPDGHRHRHEGEPIDPRRENLALGGRGPLAGLPGVAPGPGPPRREVGDERRPRRAEGKGSRR